MTVQTISRLVSSIMTIHIMRFGGCHMFSRLLWSTQRSDANNASVPQAGLLQQLPRTYPPLSTRHMSTLEWCALSIFVKQIIPCFYTGYLTTVPAFLGRYSPRCYWYGVRYVCSRDRKCWARPVACVFRNRPSSSHASRIHSCVTALKCPDPKTRGVFAAVLGGLLLHGR